MRLQEKPVLGHIRIKIEREEKNPSNPLPRLISPIGHSQNQSAEKMKGKQLLSFQYYLFIGASASVAILVTLLRNRKA